jgi:hypothetical protein
MALTNDNILDGKATEWSIAPFDKFRVLKIKKKKRKKKIIIITK